MLKRPPPRRGGEGLAELDHRLQGRGAQSLARTQEEGHAGPAPRLDAQAEGRKGLDVRAQCDTGLRPVPLVLSAHDDAGVDGPGGPEDLDLLVAKRVGVHPDRGLHGEHGHHLEEVVLDDVPGIAPTSS